MGLEKAYSRLQDTIGLAAQHFFIHLFFKRFIMKGLVLLPPVTAAAATVTRHG